MPRRRLPPLNTLCGFEAAARHLSFTRAARELGLTQGAISRQVRDLETFLGRPLFRRMIRAVELTLDGEDFLRAVQVALAGLEQASASLSQDTRQKQITVSILPTLASLWLMPRLHLFTQANPETEITIISSIEPADLLAHEADVAIRVGRLPGRLYRPDQPRIALEMVTDWSGVHVEELFPDILVPVCAPSLIAGRHDLCPREVLDLPLIHTTTRPDGWTDWLDAHGVPFERPLGYAFEFGHFFMSLDAARAGLGLAIIPGAIFANYPSRGELIAPVQSGRDADVGSAGEYYLLVHEDRRGLPHVQAFRTWLLNQASALRGEDLDEQRSQATRVRHSGHRHRPA